MNQEITIAGLASLKIIKIISIPKNLSEELSLMDFLTSNGITIASSCSGVGSCHKCFVNKSILSCQISVLKFIETTPSLRIEISYL